MEGRAVLLPVLPTASTPKCRSAPISADQCRSAPISADQRRARGARGARSVKNVRSEESGRHRVIRMIAHGCCGDFGEAGSCLGFCRAPGRRGYRSHEVPIADAMVQPTAAQSIQPTPNRTRSWPG